MYGENLQMHLIWREKMKPVEIPFLLQDEKMYALYIYQYLDKLSCLILSP